jgi:hypothetical protein
MSGEFPLELVAAGASRLTLNSRTGGASLRRLLPHYEYAR